jgi:hypothetical protein
MPSTGNNDNTNRNGDERQFDQRHHERRVQPPQERWVKRYRTEVAASMSSVLSTVSAFPLDSVKTRMQTYKYAGFLDCVRNTYQTEKLRGFFRGMEPYFGWTRLRYFSDIPLQV